MDSTRKKELVNEYKSSNRRMGVHQIRNLVYEKVLIGSSVDLISIFNRHKFQLEAGNHSNKSLQADWNKYGSEKFAFEILDEITPKNEQRDKQIEDLTFLEDHWLDEIKPYEDQGYNQPKKSTEEKLRLIIENNRMREEP